MAVEAGLCVQDSDLSFAHLVKSILTSEAREQTACLDIWAELLPREKVFAVRSHRLNDVCEIVIVMECNALRRDGKLVELERVILPRLRQGGGERFLKILIVLVVA